MAILAQEGASDRLVAHMRTVAARATAIADRLADRGVDIDVVLVSAGARLHDVGRTKSNGMDHAIVGAALLRARGLAEPLALVVERHIGGGIDPMEAVALGLPEADYTPRTIEEKVVCHADNLVDGSQSQRVGTELSWLRSRGMDHVADKIEALHAELTRLAGIDLDDVE